MFHISKWHTPLLRLLMSVHRIDDGQAECCVCTYLWYRELYIVKPASKNLLFQSLAKQVLVLWGTYRQFRLNGFLVRFLKALSHGN